MRHRVRANVLSLAGVVALAIVASPSARGVDRPDVRRSAGAEDVGPYPGRATGPDEANPHAWFRPLQEIAVEPDVKRGKLPPDMSVGLFRPPAEGAPVERFGHDWPEHTFGWAASELEHQPLYFDDVPLEVYGQTVCPLAQPAFSAVRFFGSFPAIPYKMGIDHPYARVSTLGTYRVGTCAPCTYQLLPFQFDAAAFEAGAWVGMVFLLP